MDHNKRFDQLESLLVDLARKQDRQTEQITQIIVKISQQGEAVNRLEQAIGQQSEAIGRQSEAIGQQSEAIGQQSEAIGRQGDIINRQGETTSRIERRLNNIDDQISDIINIFKLSEARHTQHDQQLDVVTGALKEQGRRTDEALQVQLQMLALMRAGNAKADDLNQRLDTVETQELRIQRLEDQVFRAAS